MKDDCKSCTLCRLNHKYVLGCNEVADAISERTILGNAITHFTGQRPNPPLTSAEVIPIHDHTTENMSSTGLSAGDRALRYVTIYTWVPAFALLLTHGILTGFIVPALGILPMSCSAVAGCIHLAGRAKNRAANTIVELFLTLFLIGIFIPAQVFLSNGCYRWRCRNDNGLAMLGAYGSVPILINMMIHLFFFLREVPMNPFSQQRYCPHCNGNLNFAENDARQAFDPRAMSEHSSDSKESFQPVTMRDVEDQEVGVGESSTGNTHAASYNDHDYNQARPSTDDETARLV